MPTHELQNAMKPPSAKPPTSYIVIPARLQSTRLPRKMLLRETGKTLIQHTFEAARRARKPRGICIATDHEEIAAEVRSFGGEAVMTSADCASGTDRIAEVAARLTDIDIFVNVQGDEPEMSAQSIDRVIELLEEHPEVPMATVATPIRQREQLSDPACVKVVFPIDRDVAGRLSGNALYFSRSQIPFAREWSDDSARGRSAPFLSPSRPLCLPPRISGQANAPAAFAFGKAGKS